MSIFTKLVLVLLIIFMPFSIMSLILGQKGSISIKEEITKSVISRDEFFMQSLETEVKRINQLTLEFVIDNDLKELGISEERTDYISRTEKVLAVQKRLHMLKASSPYIAEAKVFLPLLNRTLTSDDIQSFIQPGEYEALKNNLDSNRLIESGGRLFMSLRYPASTDFRRMPVFVIAVELSTQSLRDGLLNVVSPEQGNSVLVNPIEGWMISNERESGILKQMKELAFLQQKEGQLSGITKQRLDKKNYIISYKKSPSLSIMLIVYVPQERILGSLHSYEKWTWLLLAVSVVMIVLFAYSLYRIIHTPLRKLVVAFRRVENGNLSPIEEVAKRDEFAYLYHRFNNMVSRLDVLIHEVYEKEIRNQRSELRRLQSQISPHFLYNCFFSLNRLILAEANERAYQFVLFLGDYFRFITRNAEDRISLAEEMDHAKTYVEIQSLCYGARIDVEFETLAEQFGQLQVPRLIVQPIIENAYKYALGPRVRQGELWVHTTVNDGFLFVTVEDNGDNLTDRQLSELTAILEASDTGVEETTGLINVHRRIGIMFGAGSGIILGRSQLGGMCVTMRLKLENKIMEG